MVDGRYAQNGSRLPSWIFEFFKLTAVHFRDMLCIIMRNFVEIGDFTPDALPIKLFEISKNCSI